MQANPRRWRSRRSRQSDPDDLGDLGFGFESSRGLGDLGGLGDLDLDDEIGRAPPRYGRLQTAPAVVTIESARRTLDSFGDWERARSQRLDSATRRHHLGLNAPPTGLTASMESHSRRSRHGSGGMRIRSKQPISAEKQAPYLDLSQVTRLYANDSRLRSAAFTTLSLHHLSRPVPSTISQRLPGMLRPFSRELASSFDASAVPKTARAALEPPRSRRTSGPISPRSRRAHNALPSVSERSVVGSTGRSATAAGRLPPQWLQLCA